MLEVFAIAAIVCLVVVLFVGFMLLGVAALSAEDADGHGIHSACSEAAYRSGADAAECLEPPASERGHAIPAKPV